MGLFPFGGVAWDYAQYVLGFAALGWDAVYLEDTGSWPVYQSADAGADSTLAYLASAMEQFGLRERWAYRDALSGECFGLSKAELADFCRTADVFLNVSCSAILREEYAAIPVRALVDTDPMFTQMQYLRGLSSSDGPHRHARAGRRPHAPLYAGRERREPVVPYSDARPALASDASARRDETVAC